MNIDINEVKEIIDIFERYVLGESAELLNPPLGHDGATGHLLEDLCKVKSFGLHTCITSSGSVGEHPTSSNSNMSRSLVN